MEKEDILTQAPTVQQVSQQLLILLAATLIKTMKIVLQLRDITQAYPQSKSKLQREIYASLPHKLIDKYPPDTIIRVLLPLYGIAKSGVH